MTKKKNNSHDSEAVGAKKKSPRESGDEDASVLGGEESAIDPAILEDTFTEEFSEYNDVDMF